MLKIFVSVLFLAAFLWAKPLTVTIAVDHPEAAKRCWRLSSSLERSTGNHLPVLYKSGLYGGDGALVGLKMNYVQIALVPVHRLVPLVPLAGKLEFPVDGETREKLDRELKELGFCYLGNFRPKEGERLLILANKGFYDTLPSDFTAKLEPAIFHHLR